MPQYDVVIIGGGLGGLACGALLSREGMRCCVIERHNVVGGCLQSFHRNGHTFDTGLHFIGSMGEGQLMRQYLQYVGVWNDIDARPLGTPEAFERVVFGGKAYPLAPTPDGFVERLADIFPSDRNGLQQFTNLVMEVKNANSPQVLRKGKISDPEYQRFFSLSVDDVIRQHIESPTLRNALARNALLFGGTQADACFYHYAMVTGSNIEGPYRIMGGSQTLADALANKIREAGGCIVTGDGVANIVAEGDKALMVRTQSGRELDATHFISAIHPAETMRLITKGSALKRAYIDRICELPNTFGVFSTYIIFKPGAMPYDSAYATVHTSGDTWLHAGHPDHVMVCMRPASDGLSADSAALLMPMALSDYEQWTNTKLGARGKEYEAWKQALAQETIRQAATFYPNLPEAIEKVFCASPLTFRDYTGTPMGSAYGIAKNHVNPMPTIISPRTRIQNLLLTGQSLYVPGALGVMTTAAITCAQIVGEDHIAKNISQI